VLGPSQDASYWRPEEVYAHKPEDMIVDGPLSDDDKEEEKEEYMKARKV
jgi:hypothetical protein